MVKVDPEQAREVEPRWQTVKRWIMRHKIESTAIIVIIVGIVVVVNSFVGGGSEATATIPPIQQPPADGNTTDTPNTDTPNTPSDSSAEEDIFNSPIMTELALLTDPAILYDETSPQYKAAKWLIVDDSLKLDATSPNLRQRYALAALYTATGGGWLDNSQGWKACSAVPPESSGNTSTTGVQCVVREGKVLCTDQGSFEVCSYVDRFGDTVEGKRFLSATNECEWYGIECDEGNSVTEINILNNELTGSIPIELALLTGLTRIDFSFNTIGGSIPPELALLENLRMIVLSSNDIGGPIPLELYQLTQLTLLEFENNILTSTIAPDIGNWKSLRNLYLDRNRLTGELPTEMGLLEMAQRITLNNNLFTGDIPFELSLLFSLESLKLDNNQMVGRMPDGICSLWLTTLSADCLPSADDGDVAVTCSCCTKCCSLETCKKTNASFPVTFP